MNTPKVSVIIPTYNGADFLVQAIQSVLDQTYPHFELIVVDDASPDHTYEALSRFNDSRLKYIRHEENKGPNRARITGIDASSGEIIAWLDQDDLFHPEKLQRHVDFLAEHPDIGLSYNSRFELNHSSTTIRDIWRYRGPVNLSDQVLGFPIAPSEMVFTRDWGTRLDLWEGNWGVSGGEIIFTCRLIFEGCRFGHVDKALNYRRHQSGRIFGNISGHCESELACQETIFKDPRCPPVILALQSIAFTTTYLVWAGYALRQRETQLAQDYLRMAIGLNPAILEGNPCELVQQFIIRSTEDESQDHEPILRDMFAQLPPELAWLSGQCNWAVGQGYLTKGTQAVIWDRPKDGKRYFAQAQRYCVKIDEPYLQLLTHQLMNYEHEFGEKATWDILSNLLPHLKELGNRHALRHLMGTYSVNRAIKIFQSGDYGRVPREVARAVINDPKHLVNRGVISILIRSGLGIRPTQT